MSTLTTRHGYQLRTESIYEGALTLTVSNLLRELSVNIDQEYFGLLQSALWAAGNPVRDRGTIIGAEFPFSVRLLTVDRSDGRHIELYKDNQSIDALVDTNELAVFAKLVDLDIDTIRGAEK